QVLQLQLHLIQQPGFAFRAAAIELAPELLDLQLEMGDERVRRGVDRQRPGRIGFSLYPRGALRQDHRVGTGQIGWKRFSSSFHDEDGIISTAIVPSKNRQPTEVGRQLSWGWRQSMPDNRYPSCAGEIVTASPAGLGHKNRPRSSRLQYRHAPWPSCQITFK